MTNKNHSVNAHSRLPQQTQKREIERERENFFLLHSNLKLIKLTQHKKKNPLQRMDKKVKESIF